MCVLLAGFVLSGTSGAAQRSMTELIAAAFEGQPAAPGAVETTAATPATATPMIAAAGTDPGTATAASPATQPGALVESMDRSLQRALDGFHEVIISPQRLQAIAPADPGMDCRQLYTETTRLLALGARNRPSYGEDPRNIAVGALGVVYTPALYLFGVTAYAAWYEDLHRSEARRRVRELRALMAERRCFARE